MADLKPFAGLGAEETLQMIAMALMAISDKMPRTDNNDRLMVSHAESNPTVAIAAAQTLATVSSVTDMSRLNAMGSAGTSRPIDAIPIAIGQMGAQHIYSNIVVT